MKANDKDISIKISELEFEEEGSVDLDYLLKVKWHKMIHHLS